MTEGNPNESIGGNVIEKDCAVEASTKLTSPYIQKWQLGVDTPHKFSSSVFKENNIFIMCLYLWLGLFQLESFEEMKKHET